MTWPRVTSICLKDGGESLVTANDAKDTASVDDNPGELLEAEQMIIGDRLRDIREQKKMSQGDVEKRTGLLRCYISRVENGHTVPAIETLEKMARAFEVPMYHLFDDGDKPPAPPVIAKNETTDWGSRG